ncbi:MAG: hypothetical protein AB7K24_31525 [Gemmataceae bacterium]
MEPYPPTIIVRTPKENPKKCSVWPLRGQPGLVFVSYPLTSPLPLDGYLLLDTNGPELAAADADHGLLLLDGSWDWAARMKQSFRDVPTRSLTGWKTAYPRVSKRGTDPATGLATVEALYIAMHVLGRPTHGLLDHYLWKQQFLAANDWRT